MKNKRLISIFIIMTMLMSFMPVFNQKAMAETLTSKQNIATGFGHTAAIKQDGTVWTWGYNNYGELGNGSSCGYKNMPEQVEGLSGIVSIAAGFEDTEVLKRDGTVWTWGFNYDGELGDGTFENKCKPVNVQELSGIISISTLYEHTLALKQDGTLWAWGGNCYGQLGDGTTVVKNKPVQVQGLGGVKSIAAGGGHTVALKQDGTVWTWGYNFYGQLGYGEPFDNSSHCTPELVQGLSGVVSIAAGENYTLALKQDGTVWTWGKNDNGQLGDGTTADKNIPVQVQGQNGITFVSAGNVHTAAIKQDGTVWAWGHNVYGELGDGTFDCKSTPVQASINLINPPLKLNDYTYKDTKGCIVLDSDNDQPITGADVVLGDTTGITDSDGYAQLNAASGKYNLKISREGYCDYIIDNYNFKQDETNIFYLKLNQDPTRPYISSIILNDSVVNKDIDIISQKKDYRIEKDNSGNLINPGKCSIRIKPGGYDASSPAQYIILQDGKAVLSNNSGEFNDIIPADKFQSDIPIWVMVKYADGKSTPAVKTNLSVYESPFNTYQDIQLSFGNKLSCTIPNDVPIVGGGELSMGFDFIPASIEVNKDTFKIGIGIKDIKDIGDNWDDFKSMIDKPLSDQIMDGGIKGLFNAEDTNLSLINGIKADCDALGYIEGKVADGKLITAGGKIKIKVGVKSGTENQYFVGPVPVVVTIDIGANAELEGGITYDFTKQAIKLNSELNITIPHLEISGGVGIAYVASVRAYGSGDNQFLINFTDNYYKDTITASAGIKAKFLMFEYEKEWLKSTKVLYDGYYNQNAQINFAQSASPINIYDKSLYSLSGRDYIKKPSVWMGSLNKYNILKSDYSNQEINTLQTNIYPDAAPKMAVIGDKKVMVWLADNAARSPLNRTMLVYLVYDKTTDSWSAPQAVADDQTADFYPSIASDGSNLYVAWQNSRKIFGDNGTIDDMEAAGDIETAKFNSETNTFDTPEVLTDNNILDTQPQLAVDNGKAAVVWTENSSNDIFGTSGLNTIFCSELNGTAWSSPSVLTDNQKSIAGISTAYMDGVLTTAFATDADEDLTTLQDRDIYIIRPGRSVQRLTDNDVLDSNPAFGMFNGQKTLYWYSDGNIKYLSDFTAAPSTIFSSAIAGLSDNFKIVNNNSGKTAVIWTKNENEAADIYSSIYDSANGIWSKDIKISNVGADVRYPDGIFDDSGNFMIAFNRVTKTDTAEQSDLCTVKVVPSYNLSVNNVLYDDTKVALGGDLPVEIDLTNKGELSADYINVQVLDGTNVISSTDIQQEIKPGESEAVNTVFTLPSSISKKNYTIKVTPVNGTEYDLSDNSKDITVGYTDLGIKVDQYYTGDKQMAAVKVYNSSYIPSGAVIKIRENTPDGNVLATKSVDTLAHGESTLNIFEIDPEYLNYTDDVKALYFTVEPDQEELRIGDNNDYITIDKLVNSDVTANLIENDKSGSSYNITADFKNNTLDSKAAEAVFALYGDNERLLDLKIVDLNLDPDGETNLEQILNTTENVTDAKVFVLNDLKNINPLSNSSDIDMSQGITKPGITIGGKQGVSGEYGNALLSDDNAVVNGNGTIKLTLNQGQNPQLLTYLVLPFRADAADSSDGYSTAQEVQDSAAAFGIFNTAAVSDKTINLKSNLKSGEYIIKVGGGNGISSAADSDVIRYVYTYKSFDTNNDGIIDLKDIASAASLYNSKPADSLYNKYLDLNSDNTIDIYDLIKISKLLN